MDTKSPKLPGQTYSFEQTTKKRSITYIAVKGSLHALDCSVFGLGEEEVKHLADKYEPAINGFFIKQNVLHGLNTLSRLGYRVISSTGEAEITWTMQKDN